MAIVTFAYSDTLARDKRCHSRRAHLYLCGPERRCLRLMIQQISSPETTIKRNTTDATGRGTDKENFDVACRVACWFVIPRSHIAFPSPPRSLSGSACLVNTEHARSDPFTAKPDGERGLAVSRVAWALLQTMHCFGRGKSSAEEH